MHENQQPQTEAFELSAAEREAIEHEKHHYEDPRAASIEALKIVLKQRGWVPDGAIYAIADVLGIPASASPVPRAERISCSSLRTS
ncbi:NAD(P)H-dependent oxidoreductase subunit E, partial [Klebsiella michiganensis]